MKSKPIPWKGTANKLTPLTFATSKRKKNDIAQDFELQFGSNKCLRLNFQCQCEFKRILGQIIQSKVFSGQVNSRTSYKDFLQELGFHPSLQ